MQLITSAAITAILVLLAIYLYQRVQAGRVG